MSFIYIYIYIYGGENKCVQDISWETEKKGPLCRGRGRWESDIKRDLKETVWLGVGLNNSAQDAQKWLASANTVIKYVINAARFLHHTFT